MSFKRRICARVIWAGNLVFRAHVLSLLSVDFYAVLIPFTSLAYESELEVGL